MKLPFFGDYFSHLSADVIIVQKLNLIIKGITDMATKQDIKDALAALEVRFADGIRIQSAGLAAQVTTLQKEIENGKIAVAADFIDILASINGIALTTTPAPV